MKRPAEALAASIDLQIKDGDVYERDANVRLVKVTTLKRWYRQAKSIDARFRLDGSPRSKRKAAKS